MSTKHPATGNVVTAEEVGELVNGFYSGSAVLTHDNWLTLRAYIAQAEAREAKLVEALEAIDGPCARPLGDKYVRRGFPCGCDPCVARRALAAYNGKSND